MVSKDGPPEIELFFEALPGASQGFKLGATDGGTYAVKFREKAQSGLLGLAREVLAGTLAKILAVQIPDCRVVMLTQEFLDLDARLTFNDSTRPAPGLASASSFLTPAASLPPDHTARLSICPPADLAGVLVFNTWVACEDRSWTNYAFSLEGNAPRFVSIDYAAAFGRAPSAPPQVQDLAEIREVARTSWSAVEAALTRLEGLADGDIDSALHDIPEEFWVASERDAVSSMLRTSRSEVRPAMEGIR